MTMTSSEPLPNPEGTASPGPLPQPERAPNFEPLFVSDSLLQQAEQLCKLRLAQDPDNGTALASLAQVYRKQGNLSAATTLYKRLSLLNPDDREAEYMHAILAGTEVPSLAGMRPAPFVLLKDFLPKSFHETLLPFVLSVQENLVPALVGTGDYKPETRESLDLPGKCEVKNRFRQYIRETIPKVTARLNVAPFEILDLEVKLRAYLDGHFFRLHMDCPPKIESCAHRKVSYVYFFHKLPRAYTGGNLLLFDSNLETNQFTTSSFTSIVPEDNCIVLFPSVYWHSVVPISCPSKQFADSRFVINGHVSDREYKPVVEAASDNGDRLAARITTGEPVAIPS
jgi:Rps23 Pro-64 3,4-dihydroxylase Tpa1-like proline 4-hydroxylase